MKIKSLADFPYNPSQLTVITYDPVTIDLINSIMNHIVSGHFGKQFTLNLFDYYIEYLTYDQCMIYGMIPDNIKLLMEIYLGHSLPHYGDLFELTPANELCIEL